MFKALYGLIVSVLPSKVNVLPDKINKGLSKC